MKMVALYRFWCLFLLACACLWGSPRQVSAQPLQTTALVDTPDVHFVDYWMRANAALITPWARQEVQAGRVRPSFSSTLHPVRYGLIAAADRGRIVGPMDLFCLNQGNRSLILACRSRTTTHERFVHVSSAACEEHQPLSAILPNDCEHPYMITRTGRTVAVPNVPVTTQPRQVAPVARPTVPRQLPTAVQAQQQPSLLRQQLQERHRPSTIPSPTSATQHSSPVEQTNVNTWILLFMLFLVIAYIIWKMMTAHNQNPSNALTEDLKRRFAQALEERDAAREELTQANIEHQRTVEEKNTQERVLSERTRETQQLKDSNASLQADAKVAQSTIETVTQENDHLKRKLETQTLGQKGLKDRNTELERQLYQVVEFVRNKGVRLPLELTAFAPTQPPPANFKVSPPRGTPKEIRETYPQQGVQTPILGGAIGASRNNSQRNTPPGTVPITPHESTQPQVFLPEVRPHQPSDDDSFTLLLGEEEPPIIDGRSTLTGLGEPSGDATRFFNADHLRGSFVVVASEDQTVSHTPTKQLLKDASRTVPPPSFTGPVAEVRSMRFPTVVVDEGEMAQHARDSLTVPSTLPPKHSSPPQALPPDEADTLVLDEVLHSLAAKPPPADLMSAVASEATPIQEDVEHSGARLLTPIPPDKQQIP